MAKKQTDAIEYPLSKPAHQLTWEEVVRELNANVEDGHTNNYAQSELPKYGENKLEGEGGTPPWKVLLKQVCSFFFTYSPTVTSTFHSSSWRLHL